MQFMKVIVWVISGKEVVISLDLTIPRGSLLYVDAKLNVTLPSFNPMLLGVRLHEKKPNDYDVSYKDNSSTYLQVTHPYCALVNICICLIHSLAQHSYTSFRLLVSAHQPGHHQTCIMSRPLRKTLKKTVYVYVGQRSCSSYKDIVKHMLNCYVKVDKNNTSVLKTMILFFIYYCEVHSNNSG